MKSESRLPKFEVPFLLFSVSLEGKLIEAHTQCKVRSACTPKRAAARVCREAGARVTTNTRLSDLNLDHINRHDDRRIEVIANGLPLWGGGATRGRHHLGIPFDFIQPAPKTCRPIRGSSAPGRSQIQGAHRCRLVVLALETGGRWSPEATTFLRLLAQTKPEQFPTSSAKLSKLFAASLLDLDCAGTSTTDGDIPSISQLLSEAPLPRPRLPAVSQPALQELRLGFGPANHAHPEPPV